MPPTYRPIARELRGGHTENAHLGAAAVATPTGRLVARVGDPQARAFIRSAAKPFQLMPLLLAGGRRHWQLSQREIAVMCSSHGGCKVHLDVVRGLLEKGDLREGDLLCGPHPPLDAEARSRLRATGQAPTALHNNCSGQHAGSLLSCRLLDLPIDDYVDPEHPLEMRIAAELQRFTGVGEKELGWAVDGCGAPAFSLPLASLARAYASLASPLAAGLEGAHARAAETIVEAMVAEPEMVAGAGRFTTELIGVTGGRILGKEGANGYYAAAIRSPTPLGLAFKVADGTETCRDSVVLAILRQLGVLSGQEFERLSRYYEPKLSNHAGAKVGRIVVDVELEETEIPQAAAEEAVTPAGQLAS